MMTPCLTCNELQNNGSRCKECALQVQRLDARSRPDRKPPARARGYDWNWTKLSARARQLQPFCTHCGSTEDLQTDHTPEAWRRRAAGLVIRLADVQVLCGPCNRAAGAARPGAARQRVGSSPDARRPDPMTPKSAHDYTLDNHDDQQEWRVSGG